MSTKKDPHHVHRAENSRTVCWDSCVAPQTCASERAHGNTTTAERCACGAIRKTESNGGISVSDGWVSA